MELETLLEDARAAVRDRAAEDAERDRANVRAIDAAAAAAPAIVAALHPQVMSWTGRFPSRTRLVLRGRLEDGSPVVLKIGSGLVAEGETITVARGRGAAMVRARAHGRAAGEEWLLLDEVAGPHIGVTAVHDLAALPARTCRLAAEVARLHGPVPAGLVSPSLARDAWPDLRIGMRQVVRSGAADAGAYAREFLRLCAAGPAVLLHGDLTPDNLRLERDGAPVILDPVGSHGPAEFDMARWVARLVLRHGVPPSMVGGLVDAALRGDPSLDRERMEQWTGFLLLVDYPHVAEQRFGAAHRRALLRTAARLNPRLPARTAELPLVATPVTAREGEQVA